MVLRADLIRRLPPRAPRLHAAPRRVLAGARPWSQIPSKDADPRVDRRQPDPDAKRDIAKAFGIKGAGADRPQAPAEGAGGRGRIWRSAAGPTATPTACRRSPSCRCWSPTRRRPVRPAAGMAGRGGGRRGSCSCRARAIPPLGEGDRILARLTETPGEDHALRGPADPPDRRPARCKRARHLPQGRPRAGASCPSTRARTRNGWSAGDDTHGAQGRRAGRGASRPGPRAAWACPRRASSRGWAIPSAPRAVCLIAIHQHGIPDDFPDARHGRGRRA